MLKKINRKYFFLFIYAFLAIFFLIIAFYFNIDLEKFLSLIEINKKEILDLDNKLFFKITVFFILFSIFWTFFLGIGLPLILFVSFFYDVFLGTLILVSSKTIGSSLMYAIFKSFFSNKIKKYLNKKKLLNNRLTNIINRNQFKFFFLIRLIPGIPYQISDLLPIVFGMKVYLFIISKFFGSLISNFIIINIFSNIYQKLNIKYLENSQNLDINLSIFLGLFFVLFLLGFYFRKNLFKN